MANERAVKVGIKAKPPTLVVVYNRYGQETKKRLRKIPLKGINGKSASEILSEIRDRQTHAKLLKTINEEKLLSILSRLPDVIPYEKPSSPVPVRQYDSESENEKSELQSVASSVSSKSSQFSKSEKSESTKSEENSISEMVTDLSQKDPSEKEKQNPLELSFSASEESNKSVSRASEKSTFKKTEKTNPLAFLDTDSEKSDEDFVNSEIEDDNDFMANLKNSKKHEQVRKLELLLDSSVSSVEESIKSDIEKENEFSDLNGLSDAELDAVKQKMDVKFSSNQIKPGEEGFEYDKRENFDPIETCKWDESDDESF